MATVTPKDTKDKTDWLVHTEARHAKLKEDLSRAREGAG